MLASSAAAQNCCLVALKFTPKHVHNLCMVQICRSTNLCCLDLHRHHGRSGGFAGCDPRQSMGCKFLKWEIQRLRTTLNQRSLRWYFTIEIPSNTNLISYWLHSYILNFDILKCKYDLSVYKWCNSSWTNSTSQMIHFMYVFRVETKGFTGGEKILPFKKSFPWLKLPCLSVPGHCLPNQNSQLHAPEKHPPVHD